MTSSDASSSAPRSVRSAGFIKCPLPELKDVCVFMDLAFEFRHPSPISANLHAFQYSPVGPHDSAPNSFLKFLFLYYNLCFFNLVLSESV